MHRSILLLATVAALVPCLPVATHAATQVYDLKADWSDTQNPNGTWSYRFAGGELLTNDPFPWAISDWSGSLAEAVTKTTAASAVPGYLEVGDISVISYSEREAFAGQLLQRNRQYFRSHLECSSDSTTFGQWTLTRNATYLSDGFIDKLPDEGFAV